MKMLNIEKQWFHLEIGPLKIRTYNYPQGRVTEHRISLTKYNLQSTMGGDIQEFIDELHLAENAEKLKTGGSNE